MRRHIRCLLVSLAAVGLLAGCSNEKQEVAATAQDDRLASIPAGERSIRMSGQFLKGQMVVAAPMENARVEREFSIMRRQVSQAEYAECVADGGCKALDKDYRDNIDPDKPVVGVSWVDATAYAKWYSGKTGRHYRLPTYVEWAHAAGAAFEDISVIDIADASNPALRWIAEYEIESARASTDSTPKPFGTFGVTSTGLQDIGGNVWDWTDTCFTTYAVGEEGVAPVMTSENCGIRVLAGKHIGYIIDFIRDPTSGACSVGIPPNNLGIRLVLDESGQSRAPQAGGNLFQRLGLS